MICKQEIAAIANKSHKASRQSDWVKGRWRWRWLLFGKTLDDFQTQIEGFIYAKLEFNRLILHYAIVTLLCRPTKALFANILNYMHR